jgi:hypothetical protein
MGRAVAKYAARRTATHVVVEHHQRLEASASAAAARTSGPEPMSTHLHPE